MMGNNQNREGWRVGSRSKSIFGSAIDFAKGVWGIRGGKRGFVLKGHRVVTWIGEFLVCVRERERETEGFWKSAREKGGS